MLCTAATLGADAFKQWGIFIAAVVVIYFIFSLPNIVLQLDIECAAARPHQLPVTLVHVKSSRQPLPGIVIVHNIRLVACRLLIVHSSIGTSSYGMTCRV